MFKTLKMRLYILTLMVIMPCCVFIFLDFQYNKSSAKAELLKTAHLASSQAASTQQNLITSTHSFLASLASSPELQNPDSQECREFITKITSLSDQYVNIGVPNKDGILTCNGTELNKPVNVKDRTYINNALSNNEFSSSGVLSDRATGHPTINFAYPVQSKFNNKDIVGAAVAVISLKWWDELLESSQLPEGSTAFVLDHKQQAVASFPEGTAYEPPQAFEKIWAGKDGISRVFNKHHVYNSQNEIILTFLTGVAIDSSLQSINERYGNIILSFFAMIIVVLALSRAFFIKSISTPLNTISDLALRLGKNEDVDHYNPTYVTEMDHLQKSFMQMATLKREAEQHSISQAKTDTLTNIPNRDTFYETLVSEIEIAKKHHSKLGLILFDLDNFKDINDLHGHDVGDEVIKKMALRLIQELYHASYIGRFAGDEFIFLLKDNVTSTSLQKVANDISDLIKKPYEITTGTAYISASLGIAMYPNDGETAKELISAVDQAMHLSKNRGRDVTSLFNWDLKYKLLEKTQLIHDLRKAIVNKEFYLAYQPIIDNQGTVVKFEALIRWNHPTRGFVSPDNFIGLAEGSGQIIEIGNWVIKEAKQALPEIQKVFGDVQVSVNISPLQLSKQHGRELSSLLLTDRKSKHNGLVVEITENLLMNLDENTRKSLLDFKDMDIQVALDDFGTGYSSLSYIMDYDIDYLKIDKKFVQQINESSNSPLCETIISMAHQLNIKVIAEGIETQKQMEVLLSYECDYLQGFYFAKPMPLAELLDYKQDKAF
ncbi:EAL domain-containing protein [Marinomonas sp. C2222]|uniref:EAL domain-containing protein n=1 Tax=Marinomonas sargassi TaxID=2984494 RepID=A0ABT2YRE8_9GAMM|nr:EAL domain-containing protein [Marinomonas sargassi]MCV2402460.1 EAL domain-containing protein [Marinomonas sargassi]